MKKGFSGSMTGSALPVLIITSGSDLGQLNFKMRIRLISYIKFVSVTPDTPLTKKLATSGAVHSVELVKLKPFLPNTLWWLFKNGFPFIWLFSRIQSHLYSIHYAIDNPLVFISFECCVWKTHWLVVRLTTLAVFKARRSLGLMYL